MRTLDSRAIVLLIASFAEASLRTGAREHPAAAKDQIRGFAGSRVSSSSHPYHHIPPPPGLEECQFTDGLSCDSKAGSASFYMRVPGAQVDRSVSRSESVYQEPRGHVDNPLNMANALFNREG